MNFIRPLPSFLLLTRTRRRPILATSPGYARSAPPLTCLFAGKLEFGRIETQVTIRPITRDRDTPIRAASGKLDIQSGEP
jgi:hypothetical protein